MLKTTINSNCILSFLVFFSLVSCDANRVFDEYQAVKSNAWNINDPVSFPFEVTDSIAKKNLFINIRNNNDYAFSNLFLITKLHFPDGQRIIDTLEYDMADKTGKFLGTGFSEIKESKLFYKENITFPTKGLYNVTISHAMRKNGSIESIEFLKGITDVGFRIEKIE